MLYPGSLDGHILHQLIGRAQNRRRALDQRFGTQNWIAYWTTVRDWRLRWIGRWSQDSTATR